VFRPGRGVFRPHASPVPSILIVRSFSVLFFLALAAVPLDARRAGEVPRRPRLDAAADTNDAARRWSG
jgi:hypothetical protein